MEFSAQQIAELVGGTVEGDAQRKVGTFAKIEEAGPHDLSFLANLKYAHHLYSTEAGVILIGNDFKPEQPVNATLIRVADPYSTLAMLMRMADELSRPRLSGITEQPSFVAEGVAVPADAYIGAFAYVGAGASLGAGVGARCIIHAGAVIGADGFGFAPMADGTYSKIPQMGCVEIADDVEIGANTTIDRATMGATVVGRGSKLDNLIQIAHNVEVGTDTVMAAQAGVAGSAKIGSGCMIGGQVGIAGHIKIGDHVSLGAQSGVHASIADGNTLMGTPAVDARKFMRISAYNNRLGDIFARVKEIEKELKNQSSK